jgi:hypothetical protein
VAGHISRLEAKRRQDEIAKKELESKPGSGNIWKNKVTKPIEPSFTSRTSVKKLRNEESREKWQKTSDLGHFWNQEKFTQNSPISDQFQEDRSQEMSSNSLFKKLPKNMKQYKQDRDLTPNIFGPPNIEALKQRVREEIKTLDTMK